MNRFYCSLTSVALALAVGLAARAFGGTVGFEEDFALAADRTAALAQLIPGTEDFYYYTTLNEENLGQLDKADATIKLWVKQLGRTDRAREMENRQALLKYAKSPQSSLNYLQRVLGLRFDQERETAAREAALPTELDVKLIGRAALVKRALAESPETLGGFEDSALGWLDASTLSDARLHEFLARLARPDVAGLAKLVARDLKTRFGTGFGSLKIHREMLLSQLDELLKLRPALLNDSNFVNIYMTKLQPAVGVDIAHDAGAHKDYLDRLWGFVSRLGPESNSLKADVLYQRLVFDRTQGVWDKDRFLAYLALPRRVWYINPLYMKDEARAEHVVDLNADFRPMMPLPPIRSDDSLVRSYLLHLLVDAKNVDAYKPFLESTYLTQVFAEAKILAGVGDQDKWAAMLPAATLQAIRDRVELNFAYTNPTLLGPEDKVALGVEVKNVKTLIVKVYEVNAANFYKTNKREVNTDINLDGLVPNWEETVTYKDSPLRRVEHEFKFDKLVGRGVWVVEFIGNGISSRALVRKGALRFVERDSAAGEVFTVVDEGNKKVPDARLWMAGHEYTAAKDGTIVVPYSTSPEANQPVVLESGQFASLAFFAHQAETYKLEAAIHVARESLIKYAKATAIIRPALFLDGALVSPKLLEGVSLSITSVDRDGISSTKEVPDFKLSEEGPSTYEFNVPDRLQSVTLTLRAKVQNVSGNKKDDLVASRTFTVNEIDKTDKIEDMHLEKIAGEYYVDVLGRTGEERAGIPVGFSLKHRDFKEAVEVTLKTDKNGRISLGALDGIAQFTTTDPEGLTRTWVPARDARTQMGTLHAAVGDAVEVPYMGKVGKADRAAFSLLEVSAGGTFVADMFDDLTVKGGFLEIKDLPAGDFDLYLKESGKHVKIQVAAGPLTAGWVLGATRFLQVRNGDPLQIVSATADDKDLTIQLANAGKLTRVQVIATRFVEGGAAFSAFGDLAVDVPEEKGKGILPADTVYESGRNIGDEYRYIIDRKYAVKYPGNMLGRPGLLLNPWAIRSTNTGDQEAKLGQLYRGARAPGAAAPSPANGPFEHQYAGDRSASGGAPSDDLDFLAEPADLVLNLVPDAKGVVTVPRKALGSHQDFQIVAVDPYNTVYREVSVKQPAQQIRDLRMASSLDPKKHFTEQKQVTLLEKGDTISVTTTTGSNLESYDTLGKVYRLYSALHPDATLNEFGFILRWPTMKEAEKRENYSKYACHELNYFIYRKDPAFFKAVVLPYLKNKMDKTFMDHYLVGDDLSGYESPWAFDRLNVVEKALLGRRIAGEKERVGRLIKDRYDLLPVDADRENLLFMTALNATSLSEAGKGSFAAHGPVITARSAGLVEGGYSYQHAAAAKNELRDITKGGTSSDNKSALFLARNVDALQKNMAAKDEASMVYDHSKFEEQQRAELRQLYRVPDKTMEYVEDNYYHLPIEAQVAGLVKVDGFWKDFAEAKAGAPFLSKHLAEPTGNFTEMMFALSVLDLPFEAPMHVETRDGAMFTLQAGGPVVAFHKEIKEAGAAVGKTPILVSQNYFRLSDRYTYVDNERTDKYVAAAGGEFLTETVYGCQVVVTNPTSSRQKLDVLLQLPQGAMPVANSQYTRGLHLDLQPYETKEIEYDFYFPAAGDFAHYPVQVAKDEKLVASVAPDTLKVVAEPTHVDTTSWDYVSQNGKAEEVIAYLKANNLQRVNLEKIAWRMKDADFYAKVIALLADRHVYNDMLWSFAILHHDAVNVNQYLQHQNSFVAECGAYLDSPVLKIDPVARYGYQFMEYMPLVNARADRLGEKRQILNNRFYQEYEATLAVLRYHPALTDDDLMEATYYMLLQDRVGEALKLFGQVNPKKLATRLQYDYFAAYTAFYSDKPEGARAIAAKYADYPVDRWRKLFANVVAQLDEAEGKAGKVADTQDRNEQQGGLAASEATFDFKMEGKDIVLTAKNISQVTVNYYLMDIELMFSQKPFLQEYGGQFAMIKPNDSAVVKVHMDKGAMRIALPEKFASENVMIEVTGAGERASHPYYANTLDVQLAENYGEVTVGDGKTGKALPKTYIKVYAKMNDGQVRFYKDGYTDLRGKFDYASLSTDELDQVQGFAILVLSEGEGAQVRTAGVPKR